jgi:poly-gamma-glutamate capsule biosynthesis protein CapA/YwtB (metallophosphatase superfamily)
MSVMTKELTILAGGDIFIGLPDDHPKIPNVAPIRKERADLYSWLEYIAPVLQAGDFVFGNLEGPICEAGEVDISKAGTGGAVFKMPPVVAGVLKRAGISAVALANNHTMDLGVQGLLDTIRHLDTAGVAWAGGGKDIAEARRPVLLEKDGVRVAFLAYTSTFIPGTSPAGANKPGMATVTINTAYEVPGNIRYAPGVPPRIITTADARDADAMREDVHKARQQADIVVVSWHWGLTRYANAFGMRVTLEEAPFFVHQYQEDMGRAAIDAGADLVMGHHAHRLQGMQFHKGRLICHSLCNLAMSFGEGHNFGEESVILKMRIDAETKAIIGWSFVPIVLPDATMEPLLVPGREAQGHASLMRTLSQKYGTRFEVQGEEVLIREP